MVSLNALCRSLIVAQCALVAFPAYAQEPAEDGLALQEIIVTAQKRAENVQDVPVTVSVLTGDQLTSQGVQALSDIALKTPGLYYSESPEAAEIKVRNIGSSSGNPSFEQSVGLFVDGVYTGRERSFQAIFLDIARVEVLKGPQSLLFGKNTTAGAISITTADPTDEFEGSVTGLYGKDNEYELTGILSGPLSDKLSARLAVRTTQAPKYMKNLATGRDEPEDRSVASRLKLRYEGEGFQLNFKGEYSKKDQNGGAFQMFNTTAADNALFRNFDPKFEGTLDHNRTADAALLPGNKEFNDNEAYGLALTADVDAGEWTLTSITAYNSLDYSQGQDVDFSAAAPFAISLFNDQGYKGFSQELRLASPTGGTLEWLLGAYYIHSKLEDGQRNTCFAFGINECAVFTYEQDQELISGFVRATLNVSDAFRISGGIRYGHETKKGQQTLAITEFDLTTPVTNPARLAPARGAFGWVPHVNPPAKITENNWSPAVNVQYDVTEQAMLYASYARGTKSGGFNAIDGDGTRFVFGEETAENFEVGLKSDLFDRRLRLNLAAFNSTFDDLQVSFYTGTAFEVGNAAKVRVRGVELETKLAVAEGVTVSGYASYIDAKFTSFPNGPCRATQTAAEGCIGFAQDLSGEPVDRSPKWNVGASFDAEFPINNSLSLRLGSNANYVSRYFHQVDQDPADIQPGYLKVDARVAVGDNDGRWELALLGRNLTDKETKVFSADAPGLPTPGRHFAVWSEGISWAVQGLLRF
jgi:iron complex outermembrane recepter protein